MRPRQEPALQAAIQSAIERARAEGRVADVYDLVGTLLATSEVAGAVRGAGANPADLPQGLARAAASYRARPRSWWSRLLSGHPRAGDVRFRKTVHMAALQRRSVSKVTIRPADVFAAAMVDSDIGAVCAEVGLSRLSFLRWLSHGKVDFNVDPPPGDALEVVVLNDDFSTMNVVVDILRTVLGLAPWSAFRLMRAVHTKGSAAVGVFPRERAVAVASRIIDLAGERGEPLRAVLRRPDTPADQAAGNPRR